MKRFSGVAVLLALCLVTLAACGESATPTSGPATSAATTAARANTASTTTSATTAAATSAATTAASGASAATTAGGTTASGVATSAGTTAASGATTATSGAATSGGGALSITSAATAADLGVPIYSGLKPLSLGQTFEQALAQGFTGQAGVSAKYGVFSTSDTTDKILTFYDGEMQKAGFTKATQQDIPSQSGVNLTGKISAYQKGTGTSATGAVVMVLGPLDANTLALFTAQSPTAAQQLKPNDSIVFIFNNLSGSTLTLPSGTPGTSTTTGTSSGAPAATPTK